MKCVNCESLAVYKVNPPSVNEVHYCGRCLPEQWRPQASQGLFPLDEPLSTKKKSAPVDPAE